MTDYDDRMAEEIKALAAQCLALHERVAFLESREVCTVAHDNVETCGYCQRDEAEARLAAAKRHTPECSYWDGLMAQVCNCGLTDSADVCTWPECRCKRGSDYECAQGYERPTPTPDEVQG